MLKMTVIRARKILSLFLLFYIVIVMAKEKMTRFKTKFKGLMTLWREYLLLNQDNLQYFRNWYLTEQMWRISAKILTPMNILKSWKMKVASISIAKFTQIAHSIIKNIHKVFRKFKN